MGWSSCGTDSEGRPIGYAHRATCDHEGCKKRIDRGLGYACGDMHGENGNDCEKYFCGAHLKHAHDPDDGRGHQFCFKCYKALENLREMEFQEHIESLIGENPPTLEEYKRAAYDLMIRWDEFDNIKPDLAYMTQTDYDNVVRRQKNTAMIKEMVAQKYPEEPAHG